MDERHDILALCNKLAIICEPQDSNAQLLRSILDRLDQLQIEQPCLAQTQVPDSMAFAEQTRATLESIDASSTLFWTQLSQFNSLLKREYSRRRQILLTRLDCTIESFKWKSAGSDASMSCKYGDINKAIHDTYEAARRTLQPTPNVTLSHLLAARISQADLWLNGVVSSKNSDSPSTDHLADGGAPGSQPISLKKVIMPPVPDRGGRPSEIRAPLKETHSSQRRRANNQRARGRS